MGKATAANNSRTAKPSAGRYGRCSAAHPRVRSSKVRTSCHREAQRNHRSSVLMGEMILLNPHRQDLSANSAYSVWENALLSRTHRHPAKVNTGFLDHSLPSYTKVRSLRSGEGIVTILLP